MVTILRSSTLDGVGDGAGVGEGVGVGDGFGVGDDVGVGDGVGVCVGVGEGVGVGVGVGVAAPGTNGVHEALHTRPYPNTSTIALSFVPSSPAVSTFIKEPGPWIIPRAD